MHHSTLCEALHPSDRLPFSPEGSLYAHGSCRGRIHGMLRPFSRWSRGGVMGHGHHNHTANHTAFSFIQQTRPVTLYDCHTAAIQRCMPYSHTAHTAYNFIHPPSVWAEGSRGKAVTSRYADRFQKRQDRDLKGDRLRLLYPRVPNSVYTPSSGKVYSIGTPTHMSRTHTHRPPSGPRPRQPYWAALRPPCGLRRRRWPPQLPPPRRSRCITARPLLGASRRLRAIAQCRARRHRRSPRAARPTRRQPGAGACRHCSPPTPSRRCSRGR